MPYRIESNDDLIEIQVWGRTSYAQIIYILEIIRDKAPHKELSDLWIFSQESMIPFADFPMIIQRVSSFCTPGLVGKKTAIVITNNVQRSMAELYRLEAKTLPFEIGIFSSKQEAINWINS